MKKLTALLLAMTIAVAILTGCSGGTNTGTENNKNTGNDNDTDISYETTELRILDNLDASQVLFSSEDTIIFVGNEAESFLADHEGNVLTQGYKSSLCANADGYLMAYNTESEVIGTTEDEDFGTLQTIRNTRDYYVIDKNGKTVFSTQYISESVDLGNTTYEGERILHCNEGRIITCTDETYFFASAYSPLTVHIYDLEGNLIATFDKVRSVGTLINNQLLLLRDSNDSGSVYMQIVDKDGNVLGTDNGKFVYPGYITFFPNNQWTTNGFIDGYALIVDDSQYQAMLISQDFSKDYVIETYLLDGYEHSGTIVASRIFIDDVLTDEYYLVDLALCETDENGHCIPTMDAALCETGYEKIVISCVLGKVEPYALVCSQDGQWGYLSLDGKTEKLYTDAGSFYNGKAIVKDGDDIYIIDRNFNKISNTVTGYDSVYSSCGNVFRLTKDGQVSVAVHDN